ncbi:MAG: sugar transferase [Leptolyngbyaceae cyanobacterium MO_188.B28]|nr:sugar transferase [Leptolyngbyaceae cyanobacterium MO_188.B28]
MTDGICTLANDYVYDQVVALLNSIEAVSGADMPVCIFPYDNRIVRLQQLAAERPQVQVYDDQAAIQRWDKTVCKIWATHPTAKQEWPTVSDQGIHRMGTHRRYCAFDGPFDRFVYMDADTLLISPLDPVFAALETMDWVTYDFQFKDLSHVFREHQSSNQLPIFSDNQLHEQIFCSGFYGSKRGIFQADALDDILSALSQGEAEILYPMAPDQTILNYMVLKRKLPSINLALTLPPEQRTGNSVTSQHFETRDGLVYDKGRRLIYLHYIGVSSKLFQRLCEGENVDIPYRDVFLHYRYLRSPAARPQYKGPLISTQPKPPNLRQRLLKKLSLLN